VLAMPESPMKPESQSIVVASDYDCSRNDEAAVLATACHIAGCIVNIVHAQAECFAQMAQSVILP
jgi:hypothetical protein